jgi:hypothetical protein
MAAGPTYEPIATYTLSSSVSSQAFTSIPGTYTDLVLVISAKNTVGQNYGNWLQFNSSGGTDYSQTFLQVYNTSTQSGRNSNIGYIEAGKTNANTFDANKININNYSNTTTFKTILTRPNNGDFVSGALVGMWRNTSAITRIDVICETGANYTAGSTFTLYGITAA